MHELGLILWASLGALLGSVLHLDRVVVLQSIFHRPVFLAPMIGSVTGTMQEALLVAAVTEFVSLVTPPTGTDMPPDESLWAAVAMVGVIFADGPTTTELIWLIALASICVPVGRNTEVWVRVANGRLSNWASSEKIQSGNEPFKRLVLASIVGQVLVYFGLILGLGFAVSMLVQLVDQLDRLYADFALAVFVTVALIPIFGVSGSQLVNRKLVRGFGLWLLAFAGGLLGLLL